MVVLRKGLALVWRNKLTTILLLVAAYLLLQRLGYLLRAPAIAPEAPQARELFPMDFTLPDLQGQAVRLSELRGQVVLLNFWATWCPPCRAEMPSMNALYKDYREKGFEILAISSDAGSKEIVAPFVEKYGLTFPVLLDPRNVVGSRVGVRGIPTSYLLDKQGRIAGVEVGARNWNRTRGRRLLDRLLAEEGA
jgi:peroxiredoxin